MSKVTVDENVVTWAIQAHAFLLVSSAEDRNGKTMFTDPEIAAKVRKFIKSAPDGLVTSGSIMALAAINEAARS